LSAGLHFPLSCHCFPPFPPFVSNKERPTSTFSLFLLSAYTRTLPHPIISHNSTFLPPPARPGRQGVLPPSIRHACRPFLFKVHVSDPSYFRLTLRPRLLPPSFDSSFPFFLFRLLVFKFPHIFYVTLFLLPSSFSRTMKVNPIY